MERIAMQVKDNIRRMSSSNSSSSHWSSKSTFNWDISNYQLDPNTNESNKWDIFISQSHINGGPETNVLYQHLTHAHALNVWYNNDSESLSRVEEGVRDSKNFVLFVTDGVFEEERCLRQLNWAVQYNKPIVVMYKYETGTRIANLAKHVPFEIRGDLLLEHKWIKYDSRKMFFNESVDELLRHCDISPAPEVGRDIFESASTNILVVPTRLSMLYQRDTRKWLFDAVHKWHVGSDDGDWSQVLLLTGEAGVGKSVFASEVCLRGSLDFQATTINDISRTSPPVAAFHFFQYDNVNGQHARTALISIASQLRRSVPGVADALLEMNLDETSLRDTWTLQDVFYNLIVKPAAQVDRANDDRVFVVIDALDECTEAEELCYLLQHQWSKEVAKWLGLLITSRPKHLQGWPSTVSKIRASGSEHSNSDMASFLRAKLIRNTFTSTEPGVLNATVAALLKLSQGSFLYVHFIDSFLESARQEKKERVRAAHARNGGGKRRTSNDSDSDGAEKLTAADLVDFPQGLGGVFIELFQRLSNTIGSDEYQQLLAPIVDAREPVPLLLWMRCFGLDSYRGTNERKDKKTASAFAKIRQQCRDLLFESTDTMTGAVTVRFVHRCMKEWLTGGANDTVDSAFKLGFEDLCVSTDGEGHEILGEAIRNLIDVESKGVNAMMDTALRYGTRNRFYHTCKNLQFEQAGDMVFELDNLLEWLHSSGSGGVTNNNNPTQHVINDIEKRLVKNKVVVQKFKSIARQAGVVVKVLRLGSAAIDGNAHALVGQIIGRLTADDVQVDGMEDVKQLRNQALEFKEIAEENGTYVPFIANSPHARLETAMPSALIHTLHGHSSRVNAVALSPDGKTIASASSDETIRLWDLTSGAAKSHGRALKGHTGSVHTVAFSPDGKTIVSGSADKTIRFWNTTTGRGRFGGIGIVAHSTQVNSVAYSPNGKWIVSGSKSGSLRLWNAVTGHFMLGGKAMRGHTSHVMSVAFSPDSHTIVSGSFDKSIRLWDAKTGEPKLHGKSLYGHTEAVMSVAFSPDGRTIVSGSADCTVRFWDPRTGKPKAGRKVLEEHTDRVMSVAFSADGLSVVSGSRDKSIRVWDVESGEEKVGNKTFVGHTSSVPSVLFSPDGELIVSGSHDSTVRVWEVELTS